MGGFDFLRLSFHRTVAATRAASRNLATDRSERAPDDLGLDDEILPEPADVVQPAARGARVAATHPSISSSDDAYVPRGLRVAVAWSWRVLVLVAAGAVLLWLIGRLRTVLIPLSIALLFSALLSPAVSFLHRRARLSGSLATGLVLVAGLAAVAGTLTLVVTEFVNGFPNLSDNAADGVRQIQDWLRDGPAHLSNSQLDDALAAAQTWLAENRASLTDSAVSTAAATIEFVALTFLVLFTTFFFLRDGRKIWQFLLRLLPVAARTPLNGAGEAAWRTLVAYVRATVLVAFIDALGIGLTLLALKVEFAFPLAALVFLAAFVPIIGATVSGSVAVLVALVTRGPLIALLVLVAVIAIQQLEGHVLQPIIMGRAVAIHPLAVIVAIATGVMLAGIIGALVAVPIVAVLNTGIRHLARRRLELARQGSEDVPG
ncbi:MAG: AI-2E family transporter [Dactylosporangium sp.]|nr:AI-2E family transporter [Dactylosporangium sp.]NNJ63308.1 AI-2E family transporter [Dactylosporangium sp.]